MASTEGDFISMNSQATSQADWQKTSAQCKKDLIDSSFIQLPAVLRVNPMEFRPKTKFLTSKVQKLVQEYVEGILNGKMCQVAPDSLESILKVYFIPQIITIIYSKVNSLIHTANQPNSVQAYETSLNTLKENALKELLSSTSDGVPISPEIMLKSKPGALDRFKKAWEEKQSHLYEFPSGKAAKNMLQWNGAIVEYLVDSNLTIKFKKAVWKMSEDQLNKLYSSVRTSITVSNSQEVFVGTQLLLIAIALMVQLKLLEIKGQAIKLTAVPKPLPTREAIDQVIPRFSSASLTTEHVTAFGEYFSNIKSKDGGRERKQIIDRFVKENYSDLEFQNLLVEDRFGNTLLDACLSTMDSTKEDLKVAFIQKILSKHPDEKLEKKYLGGTNKRDMEMLERRLNLLHRQTELKGRMVASKLIMLLFSPQDKELRDFLKIKCAPPCSKKCFPVNEGEQAAYYTKVMVDVNKLNSLGGQGINFFFKFHVDYSNDKWVQYLNLATISGTTSTMIALEIANNVIDADLFKDMIEIVSHLKETTPEDQFKASNVYKLLKELFLLNFQGWELITKLASLAKASDEKTGGQPSQLSTKIQSLNNTDRFANQLLFYASIFDEFDFATNLIQKLKIPAVLSEAELEPVLSTIPSLIVQQAADLSQIASDTKASERILVKAVAAHFHFKLSKDLSFGLINHASTGILQKTAVTNVADQDNSGKELAKFLSVSPTSPKLAISKLHQILCWLSKTLPLDETKQATWLTDMYTFIMDKDLRKKRWNRKKQIPEAFCNASEETFYRQALELCASMFADSSKSGKTYQVVINALKQKVGPGLLSHLILKYVAKQYQVGGKSVKLFCGYLINTVLKALYDEAMKSKEENDRTLVKNLYIAKGKQKDLPENLLLKPVFSKNGGQDMSTDEFLQILSMVELTQFSALAHSSAFTDEQKLKFFVGGQMTNVPTSLYPELSKMMKLPGMTPSYLKAMSVTLLIDPASISKFPAKDFVSTLKKLSDLDFEHLAPCFWKQIDEPAKLSMIFVAVTSGSIRKLISTINCGLTSELLNKVWTLDTKVFGFRDSTFTYEETTLFWQSIGRLLSAGVLLKQGYSHTPDSKALKIDKVTIENFEEFRKRATPINPLGLDQLFNLIAAEDKRLGKKSATEAIAKLVNMFSEVISIDDKMVYAFLGDYPLVKEEGDEAEPEMKYISGPYKAKIANQQEQSLQEGLKTTLSTFNVSSQPNELLDEDETKKIDLFSAFMKNFVMIIKRSDPKEFQVEAVCVALNNTDQEVVDAAVFCFPISMPKLCDISKMAVKLKDPVKIIQLLSKIIEDKSKKGSADKDFSIIGYYLLFGFMVCTFIKDSSALGGLLKLESTCKIPATNLESIAINYLMNAEILKQLPNFNDANSKNIQQYCQSILTRSYTLNAKRQVEEADKNKYLGLVELATKLKGSLASDPTPISSLEIPIKKVILRFSPDLIKKLFAGNADEGLVKFMKVCLAWDEMHRDMENLFLDNFFKRSISEETPQDIKKPENFNPFIDQIKNILITSKGENIKLEPLQAVLEVDVQSKMVPPQKSTFSNRKLPDEKIASQPDLQIQIKKLFKLRLEDQTYIYDPSVKIHPSYHDLQVLRTALDRMTKPTRDKYGATQMDEAITASKNPFDRKITTLPKYEDRHFFQSTFGESFSKEEYMNQRFIAEYKLMKNIEGVLKQYETQSWTQRLPTDVITTNAQVLGAQNDKDAPVSKQVETIQTNLYKNLPPRVVDSPAKDTKK